MPFMSLGADVLITAYFGAYPIGQSQGRAAGTTVGLITVVSKTDYIITIINAIINHSIAIHKHHGKALHIKVMNINQIFYHRFGDIY
jgi:hypothetical protein